MPNKFLDWVDDSNINNTQTYEDFENDEQRKQGFKSGTAASSIRVNTALRQANLVANAIMDVVAPNDATLNFKSKRTDVATKIKAGLGNFSIQNNDGTYSKFTKDENGVLKIDDIIIPQKKVILKNANLKSAVSGNSVYIHLTIPNVIFELNKHYKFDGYWKGGNYITDFVYDLYMPPYSTGDRHPSTSMNVIVATDSTTAVKAADVNVSAAVIETDTELTFTFVETLSRSKSEPAKTEENFITGMNNIVINNIYEIIE